MSAELAQLRRDVIADVSVTDELAEALAARVAALEEVLAARWPRRWLLAARLRRRLRASVRGVQGATFADRRAEVAGLGWLAQR